MYRFLLIVFIGITGFNVLAQDSNLPTTKASPKNLTVRPERNPLIYMSTSTGINNNTGLIGFDFDIPVSKNISIDAGPGAGTWNYKIYAGVKYYLKSCQVGYAFGTGLTYCTGLYHDKHDLTTIYGNVEPIEYNKNPQTNMVFSVYKYWHLGKRQSRWYVQTGWTVPLTYGPKITQVTGITMSSRTMTSLSSYAPGGPIAAIGVSLGIH